MIFLYEFRPTRLSFQSKTLLLLLVNYFLLWKNIFKVNFKLPISKRVRPFPQKHLIFKNVKNTKIVFILSTLFLFKNKFIIYFYFNPAFSAFRTALCRSAFTRVFTKKNLLVFLHIYKKSIGDGAVYLRGLFIVFFIDACLTDDEPLWEPIEWSLVQTWLFFIFAFAWIAENLITSRYGSYTGRDKRVWLGWYKTFWFIELIYAISYGLTSLLVIVPFYYELTYSLSFIFSWWHWYTKIFFFKFLSVYALVLLISYFFQINIKWFGWKKLVIFVLFINFFLAYLLYTHFIMTFFAYFTDPLWYQKTRFIDYIQLSHEPLKWGWGPINRDHFTYHKVSTVFWFKNDAPFAGAFLMFHLFFFMCLFFLYFYWIILLRKVFATKEVTYTFSVYCVSALKQFFLFFFLLFILIFISFIVCYWRFPVEFLWVTNSNSWFMHFIVVLSDYLYFVLTIL